jgi:hypothetical protein
VSPGVGAGWLRPWLRWAGFCLAVAALPTIPAAQERPAPGGAVPLTVQPWSWTLDRARLVDPDAGVWDPSVGARWSLRDAAPEGISWKSAFEEREAGTHDGRTLIGWRARASSPLWSGTLTGDVNVLAIEPPQSIGLGTESRRWLRLAIKESWGPLTLGVRVESASAGLERVSEGRLKGETEGGEVWLEGQEGPARLRLSGGQFWDNLAAYPWQPRTTRTQAGAALDVWLPAGVALNVAYQNGLAERAPGPRPRSAQAATAGASAFHSVATSLSCGGAAWSLTVSSTYAPSTDVRDPERETISLSHDVSATLRALPSVTITPALTVAEDTYEWSGTRSQTTSASVSVSWTSVLEGVDLTVSGSYARNHASEELYDATAISATAGLIWRLRQGSLGGTSVAFQVGSNHYFDKVTALAGYSEIYGMVTLRIASF